MSHRFGSIIDHFEDPRNRGHLGQATHIGRAGSHQQFGMVAIYLRLDNGVVQDARHESFGCGFTIACGSMLTEWVKQRSIEECLALNAEDFGQGIDGLPGYKRHCPELVIEALHAAFRGEMAVAATRSE